MPWLRPRGRRGFPLAAGLAVFCALLASFAPLTAKTKRQRAADHFQTASSLLADLKAVPQYELGPEQYLVVIRAFRKVWYTSPASGYCDDSLLAAANLYHEAAGRFSSDQYRQRALKTFGFLVREYPHSKHKKEAQVAIEELAQPIVRSPESSTASLDTAPSKASQPPGRKTQAPQPASPDAGAGVAAATLTPPALREPPAAEPTSRALVPSRGPARVQELRFWSNGHYARVVMEVDKETKYRFDHLPRPARLYFDLLGARLGADLRESPALAVDDERIEQVRVGQYRRSTTRLVLDLRGPVRYRSSWLSNPPRFVVEIRPSKNGTFVAESVEGFSSDQNPTAAATHPAKPSETAVAKEMDPAGPERSPQQSSQTETKAAERPVGEAIAAVDQPMPSGISKPTPADEEVHSTEVPPDATASGAANAIAGKAIATPTALANVAAADPEPPPGIQAAATLDVQARRKPEARPVKLDHEPAAAGASSNSSENATALSEPQSAAPAAEKEAVLLAKAVPPAQPLPPPKPASATLRGKRNLIRALGLKVGRVVIDPGHGGRDTGGIGPGGLREKDLVLDIAKRLGRLIEEKMGSEVAYTRTDDSSLSLRQRTKKANGSKADLFVSIHANSSRIRGISGVETYYLSLTSNSWALAVASRENAAAQRSIHELRDLLAKIALTEKIEESREFATHVQSSLYKGLASETKGLRDRGVRKAPFMVLLGAEMPAILAEVGFLSNPRDEKLLRTGAYRQKIAEHLYKGVSRYSESLSHVNLAQKQASGSTRND